MRPRPQSPHQSQAKRPEGRSEHVAMAWRCGRTDHRGHRIPETYQDALWDFVKSSHLEYEWDGDRLLMSGAIDSGVGFKWNRHRFCIRLAANGNQRPRCFCLRFSVLLANCLRRCSSLRCRDSAWLASFAISRCSASVCCAFVPGRACSRISFSIIRCRRLGLIRLVSATST